MRLLDSARDKVLPDADGVYPVRDQAEYVAFDAPPGLGAGAFGRQLGEGVVRVAFDNAVGLAESCGVRFRVHHSKLTEGAFEAMLDQVVSEVANLAFAFGASTSLAHARDAQASSESVLFHELAYLRHVICRAEQSESLQAQFLQLAHHPHRRQERVPAWQSVSRVGHVGPRGLQAIASHPERLMRIDPAASLASTSLGRALTARGVTRFPSEVLVEQRVESFDTPENRVVLAVLRRGWEVVSAFSRRELRNPELRADVERMGAELHQMLAFDFLKEVGPLKSLPLSSTVLQRRAGYRQFLEHFLALDFAALLPPERKLWEQLLDIKDCATLYELWCFFEVKRLLEHDFKLGPPELVDLTATTDLSVTVPWSATARYAGGRVELVYNRTYAGNGKGSYSIGLRPDLVIRVREGRGAWRAMVLDAKLKFAGERIGLAEAAADGELADRARSFVLADIAKMHAYRDALEEVETAVVLYPGTIERVWPARDGGGVGAIPFRPAAENIFGRNIVAGFIRASLL